ncbi:low affinity immunoglobulin gamma Fc region receptor III-like [Astatotilapia calliptera]|uniref:low affinity immunoglobulin gamma Fc region receptor III-like n=1 Tax=Astatotilapia calliptera TaxID=8154 RepID=UPI000E42CD13|nr:low affinity immunoglobulin gamma Fc region receptor III-like [Astatotilapia calliptera]
MEVRVADIKVLINVLLISVTLAEFSDSQTHNSGFPEVVPNRQQFFELESIKISCEGLRGLTGWRVMKKINGDLRTCAPTWDRATGPCNISNAYPKTDSGEYWCEMGRTQRSNSVNITVTDGPVILESPAYPLLEGDNVTLLCKKKHAHPNFTAEFYKNGAFIGISSTGKMMNPIVSKSDEGFYKCGISKTEESPESWLAVGRADAPPQVLRLDLYLVFGIGFCILMVIILVLLTGVFQHQKHQQTTRRHIEETSLTPRVSITNSTQAMRNLITRSKVDERRS